MSFLVIFPFFNFQLVVRDEQASLGKMLWWQAAWPVASQCSGTAGLLLRGLSRGVAKPDSLTVKNECDLTEPAWLARWHVTVHHHVTRQVANIPWQLQLQLELDRECMHIKLINHSLF